MVGGGSWGVGEGLRLGGYLGVVGKLGICEGMWIMCDWSCIVRSSMYMDGN